MDGVATTATATTTMHMSPPQQQRLVAQLHAAQQHVCNAIDTLLDDRRVLYRDDVCLAAAAASTRERLATLLLTPLQQQQHDEQQQQQQHVELTSTLLEALQQHWLPVLADAAATTTTTATRARRDSARAQQRDALATLYRLLLCSALVRRDADVQLVLRRALAHDDDEEQVDGDGDVVLVADAALYRCVLTSLLHITLAAAAAHAHDGSNSSSNSNGRSGGESATTTTMTTMSVAPHARLQLGEWTSYYFGHALARHRALRDRHHNNIATTTTRTSAVTRNNTKCIVDEALWGVHLTLLTAAHAAPKLMELWWNELLTFCDAQASSTATTLHTDTANATAAPATPVAAAAPLPFAAVHAMLAWSASHGDVQRAMTVFDAANRRGVSTLPPHLRSATTTPLQVARTTTAADEDTADASCATLAPGALTQRSSCAHVQSVQLRLLAKLMATARTLRSDGGVRELVVRDVRRLIAPATLLLHAPWGVVNDVMSGLAMPSAMQLLQRAAAARRAHGKRNNNDSNNGNSNNGNTDDGDNAMVPFALWAALLRRCAREHHLDEAESLHRFVLQLLARRVAQRRCSARDAAQHRRELLEIMLRMYATLTPLDCASALSLFVEQCVLPAHAAAEGTTSTTSSHTETTVTTDGDDDDDDDVTAPLVRADTMLYSLLIRAADSRNAAMMLFLEGCASGVGLDAELFDALTSARPFAAVAALSQRLPHDYAASPLDAQLRLPADADAHARREEALRARGKPAYESTGDAVG